MAEELIPHSIVAEVIMMVASQREEYVVEFSHAELNRNSRPTERTEFKNKIDEDIYRAKKHLLKTRGTY